MREKLKVKIESIESMKAFSTTQLYDGHNKRQMRNCISIWVSLSSMAFCRLPTLKSVDSKCAFVVVNSLTHALDTNTNTDIVSVAHKNVQCLCCRVFHSDVFNAMRKSDVQ